MATLGNFMLLILIVTTVAIKCGEVSGLIIFITIL